MTKKILILLIMFFVQQHVQAQSEPQKVDSLYEMSLEELMNITVTTASKSSESINEAPAVISVITSREIEAFGALTLVDVLNRATALYITGSYYFPNNLAAMRGDVQVHTSSHVLILIDGRPCRESFYSGIDLAIFNTFPINSVERIEIIRGPGSVLYGSNAFSGVINIITKQASETSTQLVARGGSFGTGSVSFLQNSNYKDLKLSTGIQYLNQHGWNFNATDQSGVNKTMKYGQDNIGVNLSATYKSITLRTFYGKSFRDIFGERPLFPVNGTFNNLNTYRAFADLGVKHTFGDKWHASTNATFNGFSQRSVRDGVPVNFYSNDILGETTHFFDVTDNFHIVAGALVNNVTGQGDATDPVTSEPTVWVEGYNDVRWAAYVQGDYKPLKFLKLIAGGQYNKTPGVSGNFSPRAGMVINFTPAFGFKYLYGQAFKTPAQSDRYISIPGLNYGNAGLKPETVATTDLQLFYQKSIVQVTAGYFISEQKNSIVRIPYLTNAVTYTNQGSLSLHGIEAEARVSATKNLSFFASYAYQTNKNNEGETDVTAISNTMVKGGISYQVKGLSLGLYNSFFSKPADVVNSQTELDPSKQRKIVNPVPAAFNLLSFNVNAELNSIFGWSSFPSLSLTAYVDNLLDEKVYNPEFSRRNINSLPAQGGRAAYVGLNLKF
jgi:outer membrane receptor for ferrienterochelin and colicins